MIVIIPNQYLVHLRSRTYQFDEFLMTWADKLKASGEPTVLTVRLQKDIDKFQVNTVSTHHMHATHRCLLTVVH